MRPHIPDTHPSALFTALEHLSPSTQSTRFKEELKALLESDSPYYQKADTIARVFGELENRTAYLKEEITTLTALKKKREQARTLGLEIVADALAEYGITKLEGAMISSLTIIPSRVKTKEVLHCTDPDAIMELGYVTFAVDESSLKTALETPEGQQELGELVSLERTEQTIPARLKINPHRSTSEPAHTTTLPDAA